MSFGAIPVTSVFEVSVMVTSQCSQYSCWWMVLLSIRECLIDDLFLIIIFIVHVDDPFLIIFIVHVDDPFLIIFIVHVDYLFLIIFTVHVDDLFLIRSEM